MKVMKTSENFPQSQEDMQDPYIKFHDYPNRVIKKLNQIKEDKQIGLNKLSKHLSVYRADITLIFKHHDEESWEAMQYDRYRTVRNALFKEKKMKFSNQAPPKLRPQLSDN